MKYFPNQEIKLKKCLKNYTMDSTHRSEIPEETIKMIQSNPKVKDIIHKHSFIEDERFNIPICFQESVVIPGEKKLDMAMGKGFSKEQAYCSGIMEAVERYCCSLFREDRLVSGSYSQLKQYAINPEKLGLFRESAYSHDDPIDWIWGWNLSKQENVLIPILNGLYISFLNKHWYFSLSEYKTGYTYSDANGCAAGNCIEEAIIHGVFEVLERDAIMINARNNLRPPDVDVEDGIENEFLDSILNRITADDDFVFKIKYLTLDLDIPTFACVLFDKRKEYPAIGYGTHLDPSTALFRAILELFQARAIVQKEDRSHKSTRKPKGIKFSNMQYLWEKSSKTVVFSELENKATSDILEDIKITKHILKRENLDIIVVKRDKLGIPVVKVIIPGMQRVDWAWRFHGALLATGSDRIFRIPLKLGLRKSKAKLWDLDISQITFQ